MKLSSLVVLAGFCLPLSLPGATDATSPVDAARRHEVFAPGATIVPGSEPPQVIDALQHRRVTNPAIARPAPVAKYQDSLRAASAANMARFPATAATTRTKLNRFLRRKNDVQIVPVLSGVPVTRAGGGSGVQVKIASPRR